MDANIFSLGKLLIFHLKVINMTPLKTYVVNILVDHEPELGDLYYFFVMKKDLKHLG